MVSQAVSLSRLRLYEGECRRLAAAEKDVIKREELVKLGEAFRMAAAELQLPFEPFGATRSG
jgi:hypothetical protein